MLSGATRVYPTTHHHPPQALPQQEAAQAAGQGCRDLVGDTGQDAATAKERSQCKI